MINESEKLMKGSVHKDDLFFVHNDLLLMIANETINWMRQKGYLHRWLLPLNGLQDGTPCGSRPVGNRPKFKPLDHLINCVILHSLLFHSVVRCYILGGRVPTRRK